MIGGPSIVAGWFIIPTADRNMCPFAIPNGWRKLASSRLSGVSATVMTTLSRKRSMVFTRPRSSIGEDRGETSAVEFATLEWVDWFNNRRLLEPIGNIPPAEAEERYYAMLDAPAVAA